MTQPSHEPRTKVPALLLSIVLALGICLPPETYGNGGIVVAWGNNQYGQTNVPANATNITALAACSVHSLGLTDNGTLLAWGFPGVLPPSGVSNLVAIAGGGFHSIGIRSDRSLWVSSPQAPVANFPVSASTNLIKVAAGDIHVMALKVDGSVIAWGENAWGATNVPAEATNIIDIAAGGTFSAALRSDGVVLIWGRDGQSRLSATNVVSIAADFDTCLTLRDDGRVFIWGEDSGLSNIVSISGGLALRKDGKVIPAPSSLESLRAIPEYLTNVCAIASGSEHGIALANVSTVQIHASPRNQTVVAGENTVLSCRAIGPMPLSYVWTRDGSLVAQTSMPFLLIANVQPDDGGVYQVAAVHGDTSALSAEATLSVISSAPQINVSVTNFTRLPGASASIIATVRGTEPISIQWEKDGELIPGQTNVTLNFTDLVWSDSGTYRLKAANEEGFTLSDPVTITVVNAAIWGTDIPSQTNVPSTATNLTAIAVGTSHTLALRADRTLLAWGDNSYGQCAPPVAISNLIDVAAGNSFSMVLPSNGSPIVWGSGAFGITNVPDSATNIVSVSAGPSHCLALKQDGTIIAWGQSSNGRTNVPAGTTKVVSISAGGSHNLALRDDGTLVGWGLDNFGQATIPLSATNMKAIAAGQIHSLALRKDGTVIAWGANNEGQTNVPASASNIVSIAASGNFSMALREDGQVIGWGNNSFNRTSTPPLVTNVSAIAAGGCNGALLFRGQLDLFQAPVDRVAFAGEDVALFAEAFGRHPITYQWFHNGVPIPGANNAWLLLQDAQNGNAGNYNVLITSPLDSKTNQVGTVTITPRAPVIVQQPTNRLVMPSSSTTFTVSAQGTAPLSYQWLFNNAPVPNATNSSLVLTNVQLVHRGDYHVVITNVIGAATSVVARLDAYPLNVVSGFTNTNASWSADWGDFNNDGRLDLLVSGRGGGQGSPVTPHLLRNDGDSGFTEVNVGFNQSAQSMLWGDFDNDGNLDILYSTGSRGNIFRNNGNGTFTNLNLQFTADNNAVPSTADFNNDGLLDFSLGGRLYRNLGANKFTNVVSGLPITGYSTAAWADYNGDGYQDVLLCGLMTGSAQFGLYCNLGNGTFTNVNAGFTNIYRGTGIWIDFNADGKPDVLMSGEKGGGGRFAGLYRNNGDGTFTVIPSTVTDLFTTNKVTSFSVASLTAGDYDNDGQPDVFWAGHNRTTSGGWLYQGQNDGSFVLIDSPFETNLNLVASWGDYDADGRIDLAVPRTVSGQVRVSLYRNDAMETNVPPSPPSFGSVEAGINSLQFNWTVATDAQTPQPSLSYNLRVGRTPGGNEVLSANSSQSGFRRVARVGNAGLATSLTLTNAPFGRYYWAVQTVDSAFAGSAFTSEQIFDYAAATLPATGVTSSQAVMNGMLDTNRLPAIAWFEWGATTNFGNVTSQQMIGTNAANAFVSASLTNLSSDSFYYFRLIVSNADGLHKGGVQTFITTGSPKINPLAATGITASNAILNAEINPSGAPTWASFEYGLTTAYGSSTVMTHLNSERNFVPISQSITGLIGGQIYHCRVVATNSEGTAVSADLTFNTSSEPEATSLTASDVGPVSATLNAIARPNTLLTAAFFEYGATTNLGSNTSITNIAAGTNLIAIASPINGLTRLTDYYFRIVASNATGVTRGAILSFTTTNDVFALPPTGITMSSATLNGSVNPNGLPTSVVFEYGTSTNFGSTSLPISLTNGAALLPVSYPLSNLASNTTYYFRVVATNAEGIRASTLLSFQTLPLFSVINPGLSGVNNGSAAWGDYDNDGKLDLLVASQSPTRIYKNLGNGNFSTLSTAIQGTTPGSVEWGDYNNDGWLDVLVTGTRFSNGTSRIYRNNGNGTFTDIQATLDPLLNGVGHWGDFNRDGRADILLVGQGTSQPVAKIYRNDGDGVFTDMAVVLPAYYDSHALTVDYDNDGNLDLLLMGRLGIPYADVYAKLYRNLGNWDFQDSGVELPGVRVGFADAGDFDANGYPDLLYGGEGTNRGTILCLFQNNGNGTFTNVSSALPQFAPDDAQWGDYDNDGRLDILIRGQKYWSSIVPSNSYSAVLRNMGSNTFVTQNFPLPEIWSSSGGWADYDSDGRLDAVITGNSRTGTMLRFYHNNWSVPNSLPSVPRQLASVVESNTITFNWESGSDVETPANGLTHNLRIGRTPGGNEILSSFSRTNGVRKIVARGNVGGAGEFTLTNAAPGQYYWSIQAIDDGFAGSEFANEQFFSIPGAPIAATHLPTDVTTATVTLRGSVVPNGVETMVHFDWGTSTNLGFATEPLSLPDDFLTNNVNTSLTNLQPGASYFYRIAASNTFGLAHGQILSFTTVTPPTLSARILGGTLMRLEFTGVDGALFQVFASTNLVDWIHVGDATKFPSGVFRFTDTDYTNHPTRFYRVATP